MYCPIYVQLKYWYYPVGNTPAVNLLRDLAHHVGSYNDVNVLSLACGDPRNVLFSLWCDQANGDILHFTCVRVPLLTFWH